MRFDRIAKLKIYITDNLGNLSGFWGYDEYIVEVLNGLNREEAQALSLSIWDWDIYLLYELADPIWQCENPYLNSYYLYVKIFSKLEDVEQIGYAMNHLEACFVFADSSDWELDVLKGVRDNLYTAMNYERHAQNLEVMVQRVEKLNALMAL